MNLIENYKILRASELSDLTEKVRGFISVGWIPIGGASWDGIQYMQTVIIYKEDF